MRARKRIISFMLAWLMIFSAAPQVFAATFDVGNDDQMASSWETASNNSDASNTFNMTNNINMEGHELNAESGKTYVVNGNGHYIQNVEITGESNSDVVINANVSSNTDTALTVSGTSTTDVVVNGYVTTATAQGTHDGATALEVSNANVTVNGDVGLAVAGGSTNSNAYAVNADSGANIIINGDVFSAENGVHAALGADITINQNLDIVGNSMIVIEDCTVTVEGDVNGSSAMIMGGDVSVGGDLDVGGNIYISNGSLTMEDGSMLEADQVHIYNHSEVDVGFIDANRVTVGITGNAGDTSTLNSDTITNDASNSKLETGYNATVEVTGNVDSVVAKHDSQVTIQGTADSVQKKDNAQVTVIGNSQNSRPVTPSAPDASAVTKHKTIVEMCQAYQTGSNFDKHLQSIDSFGSRLSSDLNEMNTTGRALLAQIALITQLDLDITAPYLQSAELDKSLYHPDSIAKFNRRKSTRTVTQRGLTRTVETLSIDASIVKMYQKQLAVSLADASEAIGSSTYHREIAETAMNLYVEFLNSGRPIGTDKLTAEDFKDNPDFNLLSEEDKRRVLGEIDSLDTVISAIEDIKNADASKFESNTSKISALLISAEFLDYWTRDYSCQIAVLNNLLKEQSMDPEMFYATVSLRDTYADKVGGTLHMIFAKAMEKGLTAALEAIPGGKTAEIVLSLFSVTPVVTVHEKLVEGIASNVVMGEAYNAYRDAIQRVKNGDHSDDAVNMVHMTYSMYKNTMLTMCEAMIANGNATDAEYYKNMKKELSALKIGEVL